MTSFTRCIRSLISCRPRATVRRTAFRFLQVKILLNRVRDFYIRSFTRAFPSLAFSHQRILHAWDDVSEFTRPPGRSSAGGRDEPPCTSRNQTNRVCCSFRRPGVRHCRRRLRQAECLRREGCRQRARQTEAQLRRQHGKRSREGTSAYGMSGLHANPGVERGSYNQFAPARYRFIKSRGSRLRVLAQLGAMHLFSMELAVTRDK